MEQHKMIKKNKKGFMAISQITILLLGIFAFTFLIGGINRVSASTGGPCSTILNGVNHEGSCLEFTSRDDATANCPTKLTGSQYIPNLCGTGNEYCCAKPAVQNPPQNVCSGTCFDMSTQTCPMASTEYVNHNCGVGKACCSVNPTNIQNNNNNNNNNNGNQEGVNYEQLGANSLAGVGAGYGTYLLTAPSAAATAGTTGTLAGASSVIGGIDMSVIAGTEFEAIGQTAAMAAANGGAVGADVATAAAQAVADAGGTTAQATAAAFNTNTVSAAQAQAIGTQTTTTTSVWGSIGSIVAAAGIAYAAGSIARTIIGDAGGSADQINGGGALFAAAAGAAFMIWLAPLLGIGPLGWIGVGLVTLALAIFGEATVEKGVAVYYCHQWDAAVGGEHCEECNDQVVPCSEYQCRSLGQSCEFVNNNEEEGNSPFCFWANPNDGDYPIIEPNPDKLSLDFRYTPDNTISPPDRGVKIIPATGSEECVSPYSIVSFGVKTNEPAKCKLDFVRKNDYDEMMYYFGGSQTRKFNHTQVLVLPELSPNITGQDDFVSVYVRCQDSNGNKNPADFVFNLCVNDEPDLTPPVFLGASPVSGSTLPYNVSTLKNVEFYISEPAECKWSHTDKRYEDMDYNLTCPTNPTNINLQMSYTCKTDLTGIGIESDSKFYLRCKDQPGVEEVNRNTNQNSYIYSLTGSRALEIIEAAPNDTTIYDSITNIEVPLTATTFGGAQEGIATCTYSKTGEPGTYLLFENTSAVKHSHTLWDFIPGQNTYTYHIECWDIAGNTAKQKITFNVDLDSDEPLISRAFYEDGQMRIRTNEAAECRYSQSTSGCIYEFEDGTIVPSYEQGLEHRFPWDQEHDLYIKCEDDYGNLPVSPTACNIIVRAHQE